MNGPVVPWWKSRVMVAAYVGLLISLADVLTTVLSGSDLSWRTLVIATGSAIAAWGRMHARTVISSWLLPPAEPADQPPKEPPNP